MDSLNPVIIPLLKASESDEKLIGGKAYKLARLAGAGFRIPDGFCISIFAYQHFIKLNSLNDMIKFELGRKSFDSMRWEEIWDAALRIRSAFQRAPIPKEIRDEILANFSILGRHKILAVRSSAPKEDSASASFAGLHESYIGIKGGEALLNAVRQVWASLWSDAALLYQHELGLDPLQSSMAVLVQELFEENVSGVAFGIDPRDPEADRSIIEAVPGLCRDLVDGVIDPSRWILQRSSGDIIEMKNGQDEDHADQTQLLKSDDLKRLYTVLQEIESLFGWYPDLEWTGIQERFRLLQARPITTSQVETDEKAYYLTLRPGEKRLHTLAKRVVEELIPQLEKAGDILANENLSSLDDQQLATSIESRQQTLTGWKDIYRSDFIPFAHGVRRLGTYYNDAVHSKDPFEFIGLLQGQAMLSTMRNQKMVELAAYLQNQSILLKDLKSLIGNNEQSGKVWQQIEQQLISHKSGQIFLTDFNELLAKYMDVTYAKERVTNQPLEVLKTIIEMAASIDPEQYKARDTKSIALLEEKLYTAVGENRVNEAREVIRIGRLSWRLRDDDNLLLGRIESQVLRALMEAASRLQTAGRLLPDVPVNENIADILIAALRDNNSDKITLPAEKPKDAVKAKEHSKIKPRQLIGQPASPGVISGKVRLVQNSQELGQFKAGEILVCDAIQPNMTHLVPLAGAIIERRGGMLIHGAIIAREMGIPCVNGVADATMLLDNGDLVMVDGYLGIVTVGEAEFDLETGK